jgi:SAM-dependent methyltransferase
MLASLDTSLSIIDRQHAVSQEARQALALVGPKQNRLGPRMLYSPRAWRTWFGETSARIISEHLAHNVASVAPYIAAGSSVLDVGAWDGLLGEALIQRLGCRVLGVDVVDRNQGRIPFRLFDGDRLPVAEDERFDVVLLLYVLHHAADDLALLREARRVLAPGGCVIVGEDVVERLGQRLHTLGFHVFLLVFQGLGWKGRFRRARAWQERFAEAGLRVDQAAHVGSQGGRRFFPDNVLFVLRAAS